MSGDEFAEYMRRLEASASVADERARARMAERLDASKFEDILLPEPGR